MSSSLRAVAQARSSRSSRAPSPTPSGASTPNIVVTAQQSRFHADAVDAPESKEIDVKDLTLSIGGKNILDHAHLRIREGVHYVFVGRNGTGKSTLLKALAEKRVPGVPLNLRVLLLGQTRIDGEKDEQGEGKSVIEYVVTSDERRERAVREAKLLSEALENSDDQLSGTRVIRQLTCERVERELDEARLVAARRSGARGSKARQVLIAKEAELETARARLAAISSNDVSKTPEDPSSDQEQELKGGLDMLENVRLALKSMDAGNTENRARTVLLGLGFSPANIDGPYTSLSGGWRTRASLASALVQQTDVLLLDEPTNFLDLPAVIWLQSHITTGLTNTAVVVVTHDRDFADAVAEELLLLRLVPAMSLETFKGNLSDYEGEKRRQIRRMTKMKDAQEKKTKHMEETVQKNIKAAKRTGDDKKLKQAASRQKKLDERIGMEVSASGGRFKLNRDRKGWHNSARGGIEIPELDPSVAITLPTQPDGLRFPGSLVSFEKVWYAYTPKGDAVLKDVDLVIHAGERVGIAGLNGSGKSTMIKLLMAAVNGEKPAPTKGTVTTHTKAKFGYYSQHAVEELEVLGTKEPTRTALSHLTEKSGGVFSEQEMRSILAKLGLKGNIVSDVPLKALSGGQRVRLALAETVWMSPHLLVLDEVTTHLDSDTIVALIEALKRWEGALLVVTHDRFFMRCVVEGEAVDGGYESDESQTEEDEGDGERPPGRVYRLRNGVLKKLERGMQQYEEIVQRSIAKLRLASS